MKTKAKAVVKERKLDITHSTPAIVNGVWLRADFHDSLKGFWFRICTEDSKMKGHWMDSYESFATLSLNGREFRLATHYWDGTFPTETPFEIVCKP